MVWWVEREEGGKGERVFAFILKIVELPSQQRCTGVVVVLSAVALFQSCSYPLGRRGVHLLCWWPTPSLNKGAVILTRLVTIELGAGGISRALNRGVDRDFSFE